MRVNCRTSRWSRWSRCCPGKSLVDEKPPNSGAALCKATADILVVPIASRTMKEIMTILQGEILLRPMGMKDEVCSPCFLWGILVCSLVPDQHSPSSNTTGEMLYELLVLQQGICEARGAFGLYIANAVTMHKMLVLHKPPL